MSPPGANCQRFVLHIQVARGCSAQINGINNNIVQFLAGPCAREYVYRTNMQFMTTVAQ